MTSLRECKEPELATAVLDAMAEQGLKPDAVTYLLLMQVLSKSYSLSLWLVLRAISLRELCLYVGCLWVGSVARKPRSTSLAACVCLSDQQILSSRSSAVAVLDLSVSSLRWVAV